MRKTIKIPIYDAAIHFVITEDVQRYARSLYKKWNRIYQHERFTADPRGLMVIQDTNTFYIIYKQSTLTHGVIAHEIYHVVEELIQHYCMTGSEEISMLIEFIHDAIYKFLNTKKVAI